MSSRPIGIAPLASLVLAVVGPLWLGVCLAMDPQPIELTMPNQRVGLARYWPGDPGRPAVLILHGFLQTSNFATVSRLAESLAGEGYGVLTPTLSLGIDRRRQSLACEAIHTHDFASEVDELATWAAWLRRETGRPPVLIGHSTGSLQALAYLTEGQGVEVAGALLISLTYFGPGPASFETANDIARAEAAYAAGDGGIATYPLVFCREYVTTPAAYLSYLRWSKGRVVDAVRLLGLPTTAILGGGDQRLDPIWRGRLADAGLAIALVDGANHFFDTQHEFELEDVVLRLLKGFGG